MKKYAVCLQLISQTSKGENTQLGLEVVSAYSIEEAIGKVFCKTPECLRVGAWKAMEIVETNIYVTER